MLRFSLLALSAGAALFHLYSAGVAPFTALVQRPVHLAFMAALGFLGVGARKRLRRSIPEKEGAEGAEWLGGFLTAFLILGVVLSAIYLVTPCGPGVGTEDDGMGPGGGFPVRPDLRG